MRLFDLSPLVFAGILTVAGVAAVVSPASAQPTHLTDSDYLVASRCAGITEGLGGDAKALDKMLDYEAGTRASYIVQQGSTDRGDAVRLAHRNSAETKAKLEAERDGVCKAYTN